MNSQEPIIWVRLFEGENGRDGKIVKVRITENAANNISPCCKVFWTGLMGQ